MWRERIIETRKAKGITIKMMAERTPSHLTVETITRILNEKTDDPRITTVLKLGESVGLSPWELFAETADLIAYQSFLTLQTEVDTLRSEKEALVTENDRLKNESKDLKDKVTALEAEVDRLRLTLAHKDEIMALQKEIIDLHKNYTPQKVF
jgi:transcriptional regulator with XRE-family HTH domain